ncbi:MAG: hypothetical protein U0T73_03745 [Chitinophagales bacterium]
MGPKLKGDATIILTTVSFVVFFCSIVGGQSLVYLMPRANAPKLVWPSYVWTVAVCFSAFMVLSFFGIFSWKRSLNISFLSLLFSLVNIHASVLLAKQEIRKYNRLFGLPVLLTLILLTVFLWCGYSTSIYPYLYALYISYVITLIVSIWYCRSYFHAVPLQLLFTDLDESFRHGTSYQLLELLQLLGFRFYFYLLYHLQGAHDLGLYSIGVSIVEFAWVFARSVSAVHYADFSNNGNGQVIIRETVRYLKFSLIVSFVFLLAVAVCPISIYSAVFGEKFTYVKYTVKWLFPGIWMYNVVLVIQSYYLSRGSYSKLIVSHLAGTLIMVLGCYFLIPTYFFSGASAAASLSFIITSLILLRLFMKDAKIKMSAFFLNQEDWNVMKHITSKFRK